MKNIMLSIFAFLLIAANGCKKESNNNHPGALSSKYIEITIGGSSHKYEEYDGVASHDINGNEEFPLLSWSDSAFSIQGTSASGGFSLVYPIHLTNYGVYIMPAVQLGINQTHFAGEFLSYSNPTLQFNEDSISRGMNNGFCQQFYSTSTQQILTVTSWQALGPSGVVLNCTGSFTGFLYDNTSTNCQNSVRKPYSGTFNFSHE